MSAKSAGESPAAFSRAKAKLSASAFEFARIAGLQQQRRQRHRQAGERHRVAGEHAEERGDAGALQRQPDRMVLAHMAHFMREHGGDFTVVGGDFDEVVDDDDGAAGQGVGIGPDARAGAEFDAVRRGIAGGQSGEQGLSIEFLRAAPSLLAEQKLPSSAASVCAPSLASMSCGMARAAALAASGMP